MSSTAQISSFELCNEMFEHLWNWDF